MADADGRIGFASNFPYKGSAERLCYFTQAKQAWVAFGHLWPLVGARKLSPSTCQPDVDALVRWHLIQWPQRRRCRYATGISRSDRKLAWLSRMAWRPDRLSGPKGQSGRQLLPSSRRDARSLWQFGWTGRFAFVASVEMEEATSANGKYLISVQ